jgi:hypothetical protein
LLCSEHHKTEKSRMKRRSSKSCVRKKSKFLPDKDDFYISKFYDTGHCIKENHFNFANKDLRTNSFVIRKEHPVDKHFKISKRHSKSSYNSKDIVYFNNKILTLKNSVVFYLNHFYQKIEYYKFNTTIPKTLHSVRWISNNSSSHRTISVTFAWKR